MAIVVIVLMILCGTARAVEASHKHHPKFLNAEDSDLFKKEVCDSQHDERRNEIMEKSKCEPKEVFVELKTHVSYLQVVPSAVWVKRCVGLCDFDSADAKCAATKTKTEQIPVRIFNSKTNKEMCSSFPIEVHESCSCCGASSQDCPARRVYNPRKCSCQCPDMAARRHCLKQRNQNMRWNRSKCRCEAKRRATW